ncbi:hypothetical protein [Undibacterium terreum]|uniref:Uncharacterized protein n=1 Tax=Undibacterium terreum TaxID=1224302 RepID=A0A916XRM5_9BURK|nr:hypothetical protein [Undibacterium terreum]GGC98781.1 hypothetical protein GCM10011396_52890 [Undibacterium terreum]
MSNDAIRNGFTRLQELVDAAESPEAKALLEAIQIHAFILDARLASLEHIAGTSGTRGSRGILGA